LYLNIEPIHFAREELVTTRPARVPGEGSDGARAYAVLLDDTASPGSPVMVAEAKAYVRGACRGPSLFVCETRLAPIAWSLLRSLKPDRFEFRYKRLFVRIDHEDVMLCRPGSSSESPLRAQDRDVPLETFGVRGLSAEDVLRIARPTCLLYTVAWYVFRLSIEYGCWAGLSVSQTKAEVDHAIGQVAELIEDREFNQRSRLITYIPAVFRTNEARARAVGALLNIPTLASIIADTKEVANEYY
jgi:hypothetical protein